MHYTLRKQVAVAAGFRRESLAGRALSSFIRKMYPKARMSRGDRIAAEKKTVCTWPVRLPQAKNSAVQDSYIGKGGCIL